MPVSKLLPTSFALLFAVLSPASADVKLPSIFGDHMVVQRETPIVVWGTADAGEKVTVALGGHKASATADAQGAWRVELDPHSAGGPYKLVVEGNNRLEIADVLVGEVWLASGQSNMAMTVARSKDAPSEIAAADLPAIRMFTAARRPAEQPAADVAGSWAVSSPQTAGGFSATAFFFGRRLHEELDVPVGLINSSFGGTPVEAWTSRPAQEKVASLKPLLAQWDGKVANFDAEKIEKQNAERLASWKKQAAAAKKAGKKPPRRPRIGSPPNRSQHRPANLYNGMIAPLVGYGIRGAIWYQGESNANKGRAELYGDQLATLIGDWRKAWGGGEFPFLFVQLPNFRAPQEQPSETSGWVLVQEGMRKTLGLPNTGMAITIDVGEAGDIHPRNKQAVGQRLAQWALATTYEKPIVAAGPIFKSAEKKQDRFVVQFDHTGKGLKVREGAHLEGFAIAGEDRQFVWAEAKIVDDTVEVFSSDVKKPVAVRYAWAANPKGNLANRDGLPASPFRTDDWDE